MQNDERPAFTIRPARYEDARPVYALIRANSDTLLVRPLSNVLEHLDRFLVAEAADGSIVGTVCYGLWPEIGELVMKMFPEKVPVARTRFVGHGHDARAIVIGKEIEL